MNHKICKVRYINYKNSFCYVSEHNFNYIAEGVALKLSYGNNSICYFALQLSTSLLENEIGINRVQAELLQLQENDNVMISISRGIPGVHRLIISPTTEDDYEILALLAENIQSTLLDQIRIVNLHQQFVIWISNSLHVTVNVDDVNPVYPGRLDNLTEVEITLPKPKDISCSTKKTSSETNIFLKYFNKESPDLASSSLLGKYLNTLADACFILHPFGALNSDNVDLNCHFNVYVCRKFGFRNLDSDLYILKIINPPQINLLEENVTVVDRNSFVVRVVFVDDAKLDQLPILYVHDCVFKNFNIHVGTKALLTMMERSKPVINKIELMLPNVLKTNTSDAVETFKRFLYESCHKKQLLLNSNFIIDVNNCYCMLKFFPSSNFCLIESDTVRNCTVEVSEYDLTWSKVDDVQNDARFCESYGNCKEIVENALCLFRTGLLDHDVRPENALIIGKSGSGKTSLTKMITNKLHTHPFYIHTETLACKTVKGKTLESLHKVFSNILINLIYYQPSVLILDDLHIICGKVVEEETLTQESLHFNRVSEMLASMLETYARHNRIAVLATSESTLHLNEHIFSSRGLHLFKTAFTIDNLGKDDRVELLKFFFEENCKPNDIDYDELAIKTEGFVIQDIVDFVRKATFECLKELHTEPTMLHCDNALTNTIALCLQDVQLHTPGDRDFSDIGGLDNVKNILVESMLWPIKFPQIFEKAPLRLQSGLLLYGPPGTGKTILAGASAKQFGLRLISVKGPELLSKYIGASEQAVRNVFEKAQNAKPCILFFDEFDSLAPRRGHDNTGVTDRVVNQLLTQLDGIESLNGVCVVAATSRPDLLDPALLRPGRLDKQILCPLPNSESRLKILKSLAKRMTLGVDVDLSEVAENSEGFSGADLQAILYTAQLSVIQEVTNSIEGEMPNTIEINQNHLLSALKSTRPSLTKQEILKYEKIYARFEHGNVMADDLQAGLQKATLA